VYKTRVPSFYKFSDLEEFWFKSLPRWSLELLRKYFNLECKGEENIPLDGPAIIISNHSGFAGFDALMLANEIRRASRRNPKIMTHSLWFSLPILKNFSPNVGFVEAKMDAAQKILEQKNILLMFPEGEEGNFKPSKKKYRLQNFRRGFLRLALKTGAPIIPAVVLGAEESNFTLSQLRHLKKYFGIPIPLPLNLIPFPVKWTMKFLPPIDLKKEFPENSEDPEELSKLARKIKHQLQEVIFNELRLHKDMSLEGTYFTEEDLP
jgi:1-acyl-sn-glycerol-3-phosphate acyltransferase